MQGLSYQNCIKEDQPVGYWRLSERLASRIAFNIGSGGMAMSGYYSRTIVFEIDTPLKNDFPRRGVRFEHGRSARIDVKHNKELSPFDAAQKFSLSCWARMVEGGEGMNRVIAQTGRWTLGVARR